MVRNSAEKLVEALARQLPPNAQEDAIARALRAAIEALPESKAKTRVRLLRDERSLVKQLQELLEKNVIAQKAAEAADDAEGEMADADIASTAAVDLNEGAVAAAAYAGISEDPKALLARCKELLSRALAGMRPPRRAAAAISGLLAMLPADVAPAEDVEDEDEKMPSAFSLETLRSCIELVPTIIAAFAAQGDCGGACDVREVLALRQFLAFLLAAPARLPLGEESIEVEARVLGARLGCLIAVAARSGATARAALRIGLTSLGHPLASHTLARLSPALLAPISVGFRPLFFGGAESVLERGDLLALLHALRLVGLCRSLDLGNAAALAEARATLAAALESAFDATLLMPQLLRLAERLPGKRGVALRKRLQASGAVKSRAGAALAVADVLEAAPAKSVSHVVLRKLAACSGLPAGEDEELDRKAVAAKAKGELFFEDVVGDDVEDEEEDEAVVLDEDVVAAASEVARRRSLGQLDGVEALRSSAIRDFDSLHGRVKRTRKRKGDVSNKCSEDEERGNACEGADETPPAANGSSDVVPADTANSGSKDPIDGAPKKRKRMMGKTVIKA